MLNKYLSQIKDSSVLIVEDDVNLRRSLKDIIQLYIKNVFEASNGDEAMDIFNKETIHIIISDVKMPFCDGLCLTTKIRKLNLNIPIIILSAYSEKKLLLDFIKLNLTDFLIKPVKHETLLAILEKCAKNLVNKNLVNFYFSKDCYYNPSLKKIYNKNMIFELTKKESLLLELLIENSNKLVTKNMIQIVVYEDSFMSDSALKNLIFKIRQKLINDIIITVVSQGFILKL